MVNLSFIIMTTSLRSSVEGINICFTTHILFPKRPMHGP